VAVEVSAARDEILGRIRSAVSGAAQPADSHGLAYRRTGTLDPGGRTALFSERASEYRATVRSCTPAGLPPLVDELCAERGLARLLVSALEDWDWRPTQVELVPDDGLTIEELDSGAGVLTDCTVAIAETGTVVLDGGPAQGRRALSLVPDVHLCVVPTDRIVELVPEAIDRLGVSARAGRPLTFVSGPSATSDIELDRVEGVHGPRDLVLLVVGEAQS
jgi:L-lactate dehydrogenase complex protein LldG